MTEQVEQYATRSNTTLWLLILTFAVPIIGAYAYYYFVDDYSLGNHGDLIQPVVNIEELSLTDINGISLTRKELIHGWKMLYIAGSDCNSGCRDSIYYMRQINTALGKNASRFKHMIIHLDTMSSEFQQLVAKEHVTALHSYASSEKLSEAFSGQDREQIPNAIYIMDPLGNIMMRFRQGTSPKLILKDLNRLLKISRIG
ncbi:MAG: hypothetical protein OQL09_02515 [Gammaproteobacteria bacterium]|nr:hypothetical protein [Gammaproteobacteria bacterium]